MADIAAHKARLRAELRRQRRELSDSQLSAARAGLTMRLRELTLAREARSLSCYLPTLGEPDTRGFLDWVTLEGIDVLLPSSREDGLLDWIRPSGEGVIAGAFGIEEPLGEVLSPLAANDLDLMLIPAAAIDLQGHRLGWGRGYFDRCLASMARRPAVFAIVHDHELLSELPIEKHDVPVTGVVTPERIIEFGANARNLRTATTG